MSLDGSPLVWVIGAGGLLGRAVLQGQSVVAPSVRLWVPGTQIPWTNPQAAADHLRRSSDEFLQTAGHERRPWRIFWCAGAGVVSTSHEALAGETHVFVAFVDALASHLEGRGPATPGVLFVASSAGGVYSASSAQPPYDESSPTGALSRYGREKLVQEALARDFATRTGLPVLLGRLSNLYGPGQDLSKPQGLVTHICRAVLRHEAVTIYVSLDTVRDYLFAPDAGLLVAEAVKRMEAEAAASPQPLVVTKILASGTNSTVGSVLSAWRLVLKRSPRVVLATVPATHLQPRVLSFRSKVWPDIQAQSTSLLVGINAVLNDQMARLREGVL